jgi:putative copper export protein
MSDGWRLVLYLHLLAMAFFVGGQLVFGLAVVPLLRGEEDRERLRAVARRFGYGSLGALLVLVLSGWALASHFHLWDSSTLHWKLALVVLVILLALAHLRWAKVHALQGAILLASLAIAWLGVVLATGGA